MALTFWQDAVPRGRSWDGETVVSWGFRGVLGLSEERSRTEVFSGEKAGCPFRRSETRLFYKIRAPDRIIFLAFWFSSLQPLSTLHAWLNHRSECC
jgi:hypothetical protein